MLLLNLTLLIDVTFSTPTDVYTCNRLVTSLIEIRQLSLHTVSQLFRSVKILP